MAMGYCQSIICDDLFMSDKTFGMHNCVPRQGSCSNNDQYVPFQAATTPWNAIDSAKQPRDTSIRDI